MKVAPPQSYSSDDIRHMLVPKTYGSRKFGSVVASHSHADVVVSTARSHADLSQDLTTTASDAKRNVVDDEAKTANAIVTGGRRRDRDDKSVCETVDLSALSRRDFDGENDEMAACGKNVFCERGSTEPLRIHRPKVVCETKKYSGFRTSPTDSGYMSKNNSLTWIRGNLKTRNTHAN